MSWRGDSYRHYLAAKGVASGRKRYYAPVYSTGIRFIDEIRERNAERDEQLAKSVAQRRIAQAALAERQAMSGGLTREELLLKQKRIASLAKSRTEKEMEREGKEAQVKLFAGSQEKLERLSIAQLSDVLKDVDKDAGISMRKYSDEIKPKLTAQMEAAQKIMGIYAEANTGDAEQKFARAEEQYIDARAELEREGKKVEFLRNRVERIEAEIRSREAKARAGVQERTRVPEPKYQRTYPWGRIVVR